MEKLNKGVDIKKLTDKLNDGTSRMPKGEVEDPMTQVESKDGTKVLSVVDELAVIEANYMSLVLKSSYEAERYREREISRLQKEGKLPVENG